MCEVKKPKSISPMVDFCTYLLNACYVYSYRHIGAGHAVYIDDMTDFEIQAYYDDIRSMLGPQVARNKKLLTKSQH
jgi:hypothetical protein